MKKRLHRISPFVKHTSHFHLQKISENLRAKTGHSAFTSMDSVAYSNGHERQSFSLSLVNAIECYYSSANISSYKELYREYRKLMKG